MLSTALPIGTKAKWTPTETRKIIQEGLPFSVFVILQEALSLPAHQLAVLVGINPRTLQRRRKDGMFNFVESDRIYRFADLFRRTSAALESEEAAAAWLKRPNPYFGEASPLEYASTEPGYQELLRVIEDIAFGSLG